MKQTSFISETQANKSGLLPTPPLPAEGAKIDLTENARQVLVRRYVRRGPDGKPAETVEEMFWRVAYHVAAAETEWDEDVLGVAQDYYELLTTKKFFPNSPTFTGAGTPLGQLAACFVLPISDDMGRDQAGIFQTLRDAALIQQTGGGNGFGFSRLRPKKSLVRSSAGQATGPVGFLRVYDKAFGEIAQGGCLLPETLVFTDKGLLRLDEIVDPQTLGWQAHQMQVATDEGWRPSPRAYNNGVAPVLRVHTREGISLAGTPEHKVKIMTEAGPEWCMLKDLHAGDWVLARLGELRGGLQKLKHPTRKHGNQVWPHLPVVLDEELAFFLGYLAGDGFVANAADDHRVGVSIAHSSYLMVEMPAMLERLFGISVNRIQKPRDRSLTLVIDNRAVKEFLEINGLAKPRSRDVFVPRLVRQSAPPVVAAYLRGIYEADGSLSHGYPVLTTTSRRLVEEVAALLIGLGCPVRLRTVVHGVNHLGSLPIYHVRIESMVGLQAWRERIGCDQRSRFVSCYSWQSDLSRESVYPLPYPQYWLNPALAVITLEHIDAQHRGKGLNFRSSQPRLRRSLLRYLRGDRQLTFSAYNRLSQEYPEFASHARSPEGSWFVRVEAIQQEGDALTLDLEVDENHTYLAQGIVTHNTRRGANMGVLRVDHPDVEEFITCKTDEGAITNFNISVGITDAFMRAVENDADWDLRFPDVRSPHYSGFNGTIDQAEKAGLSINVHKTVRARDLFNKIVQQAHHNGEPGVLFLDAANRFNPVPQLYDLEATNPCITGETLVATPLGWRRADNIREGDEICTVLGTGRVATIEVNKSIPVFDLHLSDGASIRVTASHQFHARNTQTKFFEPRRLNELNIGDWVRVYRSTVPNNPVPPTSADLTDQEYGFLVGILVGDGSYTPHNLAKNVVRISTHANDIEWNEIVEQAFLKVGAERVYTYVSEGSQSMMMDPKPGRVIADWVKSLSLVPARGPEKELPDIYINSNRSFLIGLLDGLFSTDGSVDLVSNHPLLRFHTSSPKLALQVRRILLMFGIHGRISTSQRKRHEINGREIRYDRPKYDVIIAGESLGRFFEQIPLSHPAKRMRLEDAALRSNFTGGNWAARVVGIEPAGEATVYDLYEPKSDTWITEGYVSRGCGEQFLGPYENCCLGSVNLAQHFGPEGTLDWEKLRQSVALSTRFLDDVVQANAYVPAVPQLKDSAHRARRIGLGIMGLGDLMYFLGIRYGSPEGQEFAAQVMEFVRYHAMLTSIDLAEKRGAFPAIEGSIYDPQDLHWTPPLPLEAYSHDWGRPEVDWERVVSGIKAHGIRNAAQTTVAPTGTIATVAGCEGYGCEPVFALAYIRHVNDNGKDLQLVYTSPQFEQALIAGGLDEATRAKIVERVMESGTCQGIEEVPEDIRHTYVVSADITAEEHVRMQGAMQAFVDNSLSKCVTGDTLVLTAEGLAPIASLSDMRQPDQFEAQELTIQSPDGAERSDSFYYGGMRETRRVTLAHGFEIEGTPNHRVHVLQADGSVDFKLLDDLKIGDEVVLYMNQQVFGPEGRPLPPYHGEFRTNAKEIRFPERMSTELAYILGCITSEGSIGQNSIQICNGDRELLERLGESFENLFGLGSHIVQDLRRESVYALQINSRPLRNWLLNDLSLEAGARNKVIPNCILGADRSEIAAFLRGLFLDAYMTLDGRMFGIGLASRKLIRQLQTLFLNFGVFSMLHQSAENAWALNVSGEALELLSAFVEFEEVWKNERIQIRNEGRVNIRHNYATLLPERVTEELRSMQEEAPISLRSLFGELPRAYGLQEREYQRSRVNLLQGHRIDRPLAQRIYKHYQAHATPFTQKFFAQDQEGKLYVKVQRIEADFNEVFDISVPGSHSFIANGMGNHNTVNFPAEATEEDVATAYMLAWKLGCKGITVYVTGSREVVVLETKATAAQKMNTETLKQDAEALKTESLETEGQAEQLKIWYETKKPRPKRLHGYTFNINTPLGKTFVTINENGGNQPFEVFVNTSKAGSDTAAVSEAIGRLISYVLRMASPVVPRERLREVFRQLSGIGGGRSLGFGPNRVRSLPDGVAHALGEYLEVGEENGEFSGVEYQASLFDGNSESEPQAPSGNGYHSGDDDSEEVTQVMISLPRQTEPQPTQAQMKIGDLCPECGEAAVVNEEGCRKCYACGFSEC